MLLLTVAAFCGLLVITAIFMTLVGEVKIGGSNYLKIKELMVASEKSVVLRSDILILRTQIANPDAEAGSEERTRLIASINSKFPQLRPLLKSQTTIELLSKAESSWREYSNYATKASSSSQNLFKTALPPGVHADQLKKCIASIETLSSTLHDEINGMEKENYLTIRFKFMASVVAILIVAAFFGFLSHLASESINNPLNSAIELAGNIASGMFDKRINKKYSGEAGLLTSELNRMAESIEERFSEMKAAGAKIRSLEGSLTKTAQQLLMLLQRQEDSLAEASRSSLMISTTAEDIYSGVEKLSTTASESSSSILEISTCIEEIATSAERLGMTVDEVSSSIIEMVASVKEIGVSITNLHGTAGATFASVAEMDNAIKQVEKNAMDTAAISESAKMDAETGKRAVEDAIAGIQAIRASSRITAEVVENLSIRVNDIGTILSVIDEVAEQTNLLALNAAIIAAQAGDYGKGFAVVADEIRELSERTSSSTREIAAVIQALQDETTHAVSAIRLAEESVSEGERLSERSGAALQKIYSGVEQASLQIRKIALATVEQAKGSRAIKELMGTVSEMVRQIAKSADEHTVTGELIIEAVESMKNLTGHVRLSTREQSKASSLIAGSTESINILINVIKNSCRTQREAGGQNRKTVESISSAVSSTASAIKSVEAHTVQLAKQSDQLLKET